MLPLVPMFVGPLGFLIVVLLVFILILVAARLIFNLAWKFLVIAAVILALFWVLGAIRLGPLG